MRPLINNPWLNLLVGLSCLFLFAVSLISHRADRAGQVQRLNDPAVRRPPSAAATHNGHGLGLLPGRQPGYTAIFYTTVWPTYARADCIAKIHSGEGSLYSLGPQVLDQDGEGWCWAFGPTHALMCLSKIVRGDGVILDPCVGPVVTGVYGGNTIDAMLDQVQSVYGQPDAAGDGDDPITANLTTSLPVGWQTRAKKWFVPSGEWLTLTSAEDMASAILNGHPVVLGTTEPWGGHCICCLEVSLSSDGSSFIFAGPNSWGATWANDTGSYPGRPGWWQLDEATLSAGGAFDDSGDGLGSYALCGMADSSLPPPGATSGSVHPTPSSGAKRSTESIRRVQRNGHTYRIHYATAP